MKNGNRFKYTTLTKGMLDKIFGDLFYGSNIPIERRRVKVQVGTAASIELSKLFENEFGKTPFTINASDIGLLSGDRNNLSFQYRFTSMQFPTAGLVEFEINPAFDSIYGSRGMDRLSGEFPPSSHTIAIFDVTDSNSSSAAAEMTTPYTSDPELNSSSNLVLIKPKNRTGIDWGYEIGTEAPPGFSRQGLVSSSQRDGYAIWMKSFSSIWLKDATRSILLEKNLPR